MDVSDRVAMIQLFIIFKTVAAVPGRVDRKKTYVSSNASPDILWRSINRLLNE